MDSVPLIHRFLTSQLMLPAGGSSGLRIFIFSIATPTLHGIFYRWVCISQALKMFRCMLSFLFSFFLSFVVSFIS